MDEIKQTKGLISRDHDLAKIRIASGLNIQFPISRLNKSSICLALKMQLEPDPR